MCRAWPADGARSKQRCQKSMGWERRLQPGSILHWWENNVTTARRKSLRHWREVADVENTMRHWGAATWHHVTVVSGVLCWISFHLLDWSPLGIPLYTHLENSHVDWNDGSLLVVLFPTLDNSLHSLIKSNSTWFSLRLGRFYDSFPPQLKLCLA